MSTVTWNERKQIFIDKELRTTALVTSRQSFARCFSIFNLSNRETRGKMYTNTRFVVCHQISDVYNSNDCQIFDQKSLDTRRTLINFATHSIEHAISLRLSPVSLSERSRSFVITNVEFFVSRVLFIFKFLHTIRYVLLLCSAIHAQFACVFGNEIINIRIRQSVFAS